MKVSVFSCLFLVPVTLAQTHLPRTKDFTASVQITASPLTAKPVPAGLNEAIKQHVTEVYGNLPLSFEANLGQAEAEVKFISVSRGYTVFLTSTAEPVLLPRRWARQECGWPEPEQRAALHKHQSAISPGQSAGMRIRLVGARRGGPRQVQGLEQLPGKSNYFIGQDPKKWHTAIPHFAKVRYDKVYPGVDVVYHGNQQQLEFDFVVAPGANPKAITLGLEGARQVQIDARGDLVLQTTAGEIRLHKPRLYQPGKAESARRETLSGGYVLKGPRQVGFELAAYDTSRPLIIDPVLSYSTYLGGSAYDQGNGIAVDAFGNAYVTGFTNSTKFPTTPGSYDTTAASADIFVSKLNPGVAGAASLVYSTYLGGGRNDFGKSIAVDSSGNAYVTGQTFSSDFPTTVGAFQTALGGIADAFVAKLSADGSSLVYSTYLGGAGLDQGRAIALDALNNAYLTGFTYSNNFPTMNAIQAAKGDSQDADAFVAELAANGSSLVYSTYLGGGSYDQGNGVAVDGSGNTFVAGFTRSSDFPTVAALQGTCGSCPTMNDAFVVEIGAGGSPLLYSTYLGGSAEDKATSIALDSSGNAYLTGLTSSTNFPTTSGAFKRSLVGFVGAFVSKLSSGGSALVYSTYLSANKVEFGQGIVVASGNAYVTGQTMSTNFPVVQPSQATCGGGTTSACLQGDAFVTVLNPAGSALSFSTYLGGAGSEEGNGIAVDSSGNAYVTGDTASSAFPTANPFQATFKGGRHDAFLAKITLAP
jgi:hypothetical protein